MSHARELPPGRHAMSNRRRLLARLAAHLILIVLILIVLDKSHGVLPYL